MWMNTIEPESPDARPGPEPPARAQGPAPSTGVMRHNVLVVDDNEAFAGTVADTLGDRDIAATPVSDPKAALELARQQHFSVAVVDLIMPEMDGLQLARELHRADPAIEIVMLTGHADMSSAIEAIRSELFDYLQKDSLQPARLRRAVRAAIARRELRAENRRLLSSLQQTTRRLEILGDLSARLAAEPRLDRLLAELVRDGRQLVEAESVRVLLTERNDLGDMMIRACVGDGDAPLGGLFGPGDGIATSVFTRGTGLRVEVPQDHANYSSRCDDMGTALPGLLCVPLVGASAEGVLTAAGRLRPFTDEDLSLLTSLARQGAVAIENARAREVSQNFYTHTSDMLVSLLDAQDFHYEGHSRAVAALTDMVTRALGLPEDERRTLHFAALLHDVGKLRLRPGLLGGTRPLSAEEMALVRQHPALGVEVVRPIARWVGLASVIHTHHERWDGHGYPRGLAGNAIPLGGRIVGIAEAFEAMTRATPYRTPRSIDEALDEVAACAGTQFDPDIALLFVEEYRKNRERLASV